MLTFFAHSKTSVCLIDVSIIPDGGPEIKCSWFYAYASSMNFWISLRSTVPLAGLL